MTGPRAPKRSHKAAPRKPPAEITISRPDQIDPGGCPSGLVVHVYDIAHGVLLTSQRRYALGADQIDNQLTQIASGRSVLIVTYDGDSGERCPINIWSDSTGGDQRAIFCGDMIAGPEMIRTGPEQVDPGGRPNGVVCHLYRMPDGELLYAGTLGPGDEIASMNFAAAEATSGAPVVLVVYSGDSGRRGSIGEMLDLLTADLGTTPVEPAETWESLR